MHRCVKNLLAIILAIAFALTAPAVILAADPPTLTSGRGISSMSGMARC